VVVQLVKIKYQHHQSVMFKNRLTKWKN
jgi:hypothetical protein